MRAEGMLGLPAAHLCVALREGCGVGVGSRMKPLPLPLCCIPLLVGDLGNSRLLGPIYGKELVSWTPPPLAAATGMV